MRDAKSQKPMIYTTVQNCVHVLVVYIDGLVQDCSNAGALSSSLALSHRYIQYASYFAGTDECYTDPAWLSLTNERKFVD